MSCGQTGRAAPSEGSISNIGIPVVSTVAAAPRVPLLQVLIPCAAEASRRRSIRQRAWKKIKVQTK